MSEDGKYWGKYRGTVLNNVDPMQIGRLLVQVPDVGGPIPSTWAMPCLPMTGKQSGVWVLPQVGAGVWVEFEHGDIDYPIWTGCWYGSMAEVPPLALLAPPTLPNIVLQTGGQTTPMLSDHPGPDRRHPAQASHRRDDRHQRRRHHHLERQRRDDRDDGPDGHGQRRRADRDVRERTMPGPILHGGDTMICPHGGQVTTQGRPVDPFAWSGEQRYGASLADGYRQVGIYAGRI